MYFNNALTDVYLLFKQNIPLFSIHFKNEQRSLSKELSIKYFSKGSANFKKFIHFELCWVFSADTGFP